MNIVFWHGWGMGAKAWKNFLPLMPENYSCIAQPLSGYENSPAPVPYNAETVTESLISQFDEPIVLCAWSLGAMLALYCARRFPQKIKKLVLFGATPCFIQKDSWTAAVNPANLSAFQNGIENDAEKTLKGFITQFNHKDKNARNNIRELSDMNIPPKNILLGGLDILENLDLRNAVTRIKTKTCLIHGECDPLMPLAAAKWLENNLSDAKLHVCAGAAHAPFISNPDFCANVMRGFLEE